MHDPQLLVVKVTAQHVNHYFVTEELFKQLVSNKAQHVSKAGHIHKLNNRDLPTACFALYDNQRTHALHRQCIKNH